MMDAHRRKRNVVRRGRFLTTRKLGRGGRGRLRMCREENKSRAEKEITLMKRSGESVN